MPRLSAAHHRNNASMSAFQLNTNKATIAQIWNTPRNRVIVRLRGWAKVRSPLRILVPGVLEADTRLQRKPGKKGHRSPARCPLFGGRAQKRFFGSCK